MVFNPEKRSQGELFDKNGNPIPAEEKKPEPTMFMTAEEVTASKEDGEGDYQYPWQKIHNN